MKEKDEWWQRRRAKSKMEEVGQKCWKVWINMAVSSAYWIQVGNHELDQPIRIEAIGLPFTLP